MFPGFLYPYTIKYISVTPGQTGQIMGEWTAPAQAAEVAITGVVQTLTLKELERLDGGIFSLGSRKITVDKSVGIKPGDQLKISEDSLGATVTQWEVVSKLDMPSASFASLELTFETFLLKRITA